MIRQTIGLLLLALLPLTPTQLPTSHDFGRVRQGDTVTHEFRVVPPGGRGVARVARVDLTGPGMTARFKPETPAGQPISIRVTWNTSKVDGAVEAQALVHWAAPGQAPTVLTIRGTVVPPIELHPLGAVFFSVFSDERAEQQVQIINHEPRPLRIERLEPAGSHFSATVRVLQPGKRFEVRVTVPAGQTPGRFREALAIYTDAPGRRVIHVPVNVFVKADVYANPESVDFGIVQLGALRRNPASLSLTAHTVLIKRRQGAFTIRGAVTNVPGVRLTVSEGSEATHRLEVSLIPAQLRPGPLAGSIVVETSDAAFPRLEIPVRGRIVTGRTSSATEAPARLDARQPLRVPHRAALVAARVRRW